MRSSGTYAAVPLEDLLEVDPQGKQEHPTSHPKLTTELDADQSSFLGAIELMNPQNPLSALWPVRFGRADVTSGRHRPLSAPGALFGPYRSR